MQGPRSPCSRQPARSKDPLCRNNTTDESAAAPLLYSAGAGNTSNVRCLLDGGADVNAANEGGWTALMFAANKGHTDTARLLLDKGANINAADEDDNSPLTLAVERGHTGTVRLLLDTGADVNATFDRIVSWAPHNFGWTLLMFAAESGHTDTVRLLIERGAAVNAANGGGWTALMLAAEGGDTDTITLLLDKGADLNAADIQLLKLILAQLAPNSFRRAAGQPILTRFQLLFPQNAHRFIAPALHRRRVRSQQVPIAPFTRAKPRAIHSFLQ